MAAFGTLLGTLSGNGNSVGATNAVTGSVAVAVGDLIVVVFGQQTNLTATGATDNLDANAYTAQNAGTDAGTSTGRVFYKRVVTAGTLTTITVAASSSTNDYASIAGVFAGGIVLPVDTNPANGADISSPFNCPATGTLGQASEIVIAWGTCPTGTTAAWTATSPNLLAGQTNNSTNIKAVLGYQVVNATTSVVPVFACGTNPADDTLGTFSFKQDLTQPFGIGREANVQRSLAAIAPPRALGFDIPNLSPGMKAKPVPMVNYDWPLAARPQHRALSFDPQNLLESTLKPSGVTYIFRAPMYVRIAPGPPKALDFAYPNLLLSTLAPSSAAHISGGIVEGADASAGTVKVAVKVSGAIVESPDASSGSIRVAVHVSGGATEGADATAGTINVAVHISGAITEDADASAGNVLAGVTRLISGGITEADDGMAGAISGVVTGGHFLPLTKKQIAEARKRAKAARDAEQAGWDQAAKDKADLHKQIMATLHPETVSGVGKAPDAVAEDDDEEDIETILLYG